MRSRYWTPKDTKIMTTNGTPETAPASGSNRPAASAPRAVWPHFAEEEIQAAHGDTVLQDVATSTPIFTIVPSPTSMTTPTPSSTPTATFTTTPFAPGHHLQKPLLQPIPQEIPKLRPPRKHQPRLAVPVAYWNFDQTTGTPGFDTKPTTQSLAMVHPTGAGLQAGFYVNSLRILPDSISMYHIRRSSTLRMASRFLCGFIRHRLILGHSMF